jgi:hypothetical protein
LPFIVWSFRCVPDYHITWPEAPESRQSKKAIFLIRKVFEKVRKIIFLISKISEKIRKTVFRVRKVFGKVRKTFFLGRKISGKVRKTLFLIRKISGKVRKNVFLVRKIVSNVKEYPKLTLKPHKFRPLMGKNGQLKVEIGQKVGFWMILGI